MPDLEVEDLVKDVIRLSRESVGVNDLLQRFGALLKNKLSGDEVIVKFLNKANSDMTPGDEFILNTNKPYLDNMLSGYSAFADLINYFNSGYKSCLILPIVIDDATSGVVTLLSKSEERFKNSYLDALGLICSMLGQESSAKLERERNISIAKYFDASFENLTPQALIDRRLSIIKANKNMLNLVEKSSTEITGKNVSEFFTADENALGRILNGQPADLVNMRDARRFRAYSKQINDNLFHITFQDTTELSRLKQLSRFFNHSNEVFILLDSRMRITWVSDNMDFLFKVDKEALVGRKFVDIAPEYPVAERFSAIGDGPLLDNARLKLDNGIAVEARIVALKGPDGFSLIISKNLDRYIGNIKKNIDDMITLSSDAIMVTDELGYIKEVNKTAKKLLKYDDENLMGQSILSLCADAESKGRISSSLNLVKNKGLVTDLFITLLGNSGAGVIPFQQSIRAILNEENKVVGYMFIGKELATRKEIDRLQGSLENIGKQTEKLKSESDLKTQFIYNISHDLKTPITNIIGFSKFLLQGEFGELNDEQKKNTKIIIDESDRLMQLISQILDVAKLSSSKIKLDLKHVDFNTLLENQSIKLFNEIATTKGLSFYYKVDPNVPEIEADPNRLIQVFSNLIGNALKFTETGGITIRVLRKGKNVRVEVQDTGIGISNEDRPKIFKRFFQLPRKGLTRQEGAGTGLGLTIAKEIVNLHGGRIGIISEPKKGSTFWFTLPIYGNKRKKAQA